MTTISRRELLRQASAVAGTAAVGGFTVKGGAAVSASPGAVPATQSLFRAIGPTEPVRQPPGEKGGVRVAFDLLPVTMQYDFPTFFFMVTENGIKFTNFAAETYDPRHWRAKGGAASFEPLQDRENRYVRVWIKHQSDARIVVRVRYALCNNKEEIAHPDIPSGSPYGKGDWADEYWTIYPDGTNIRHMKIHTGLAPMARPFGFDRTPPKVVFEFVETAVQGLPGHMPTDDIEIDALTLIRLVGDFTETLLPEGKSTTISYNTYPEDFGDFRDANIMLINVKAQYRPFTIGMPYGVRIQPYKPEEPVRYVFNVFGWTPDSNKPFFTSIGHILNYWHYKRTDNTLEQIYLQGMTNAADPVKELVPLAWSWIAAPRLQMEGLVPSYTTFTYDPAQKAYIVPRKDWEWGPTSLEFTLEQDPDFAHRAPNSIVNPAFVIKNWGKSGVLLRINSKPVQEGESFRVGYEDTPTGTDLVMWLKMKTSDTVHFSISPKLPKPGKKS